MKKFIRIKRSASGEYAYEITPYYDPKTKNTRHKSRYLGKIVDGKIVRVRTKLPRNSYDYGEFLPFLKIMHEFRIKDILKTFIAESKANVILTLAFNKLVSPVAMCNIRSWYERTWLSKTYGDIPLSTQFLSDFLGDIGDSGIAMRFSHQFIKEIGKGSPLIYDITSLSSSSKLINLLEYGYNRDDDGLPQINLSLVVHKSLGIPLFFDIYSGSIVDVSTLKNTVEKLNAFGLEKPTIILDRGFFSTDNLIKLVEEGYDFIMPAPYTFKPVRSLVSKVHKELEDARLMKMYNKEILFVKDVEIPLGKFHVKGYLFYDLKREQEEKTLFYERLHRTMEALEERKLRGWENPKEVFEELAGSFASYIGWRIKEGHFQVIPKEKAIAQRMNRMGKTVILYQGDYSWEDVLTWNRERDVVEKMFMQIKNDLEGVPFRAQKTEVVKGMIFVTFLALIMRARLLMLLKETKLVEKYSIPSLLIELSKIKKVELSDGTFIVTEITKTQREIIEKLGLVP